MARKKPNTRKRKPAATTPNGVLVQLDGDDMTVAPLGSVKQTELPALLGIARRVTEEQLGIGGG